MNKFIFLIISMCILGGLFGLEFESPSKRHVNFTPLDQIKYNLRAKGSGLDYRELFDKVVAEEKMGFLGYHGDSLDFLIYQDIIRITIEAIVGIPVRNDFHFLSIPCHTKLRSLEALSQLFVEDNYQVQQIVKSTFPLNFSLYSNHNCCGLNSMVNFSKNSRDSSSKKEY